MKEKEKDIFDKIMALPGLNIFEGFYQKYKEMLLYLFFGGMTAVISIGSYSYCDVGLGFDPLIANIISWILAVTFAYVTNKVWVFSVETHGMHELFIEAFHFFTGRLFTLIVEEAILLIFISKLHLLKNEYQNLRIAYRRFVLGHADRKGEGLRRGSLRETVFFLLG